MTLHSCVCARQHTSQLCPPHRLANGVGANHNTHTHTRTHRSACPFGHSSCSCASSTAASSRWRTEPDNRGATRRGVVVRQNRGSVGWWAEPYLIMQLRRSPRGSTRVPLEVQADSLTGAAASSVMFKNLHQCLAVNTKRTAAEALPYLDNWAASSAATGARSSRTCCRRPRRWYTTARTSTCWVRARRSRPSTSTMSLCRRRVAPWPDASSVVAADRSRQRHL